MQSKHLGTHKNLAAAIAIGMVACALAGGVGGAGAKTNHAWKAGPAIGGKGALLRPAVDPAALPPGYTVGSGDAVTARAGEQARADVTCPGKTKPVGGGAANTSTSTLVSINSSYPADNRSWRVYVNNLSDTDTTIAAYAVCVTLPESKYTVSGGVYTGAPGVQTQGTAMCDSGVVVGGGVYSLATDPAVSVNSLFPDSTTSWRADMNNGTGSPQSFSVYAICRNVKPAGYLLRVGTNRKNPAGSQTKVTVTCPGARVPLSGGAVSDSSSTLASLNESIPTGQSWISYENNETGADSSVTPYVICAGK